MKKCAFMLNGKEYHSLQEMCVDYNIDYSALLKFKVENKTNDLFDLLQFCFDRVYYNMETGSFLIP